MAEKSENMLGSESDIGNYYRFIPVPLCCQETPYTCGVACVQSVLASYGIIYRQDALSEFLKQKPLFGTDVHNIVNFMQMLGFQASYQVELDIGMLKKYIDHRITPILTLQAWKDDEIDYEYDWRDGHYTVACGYDDDRILFMDPWTLGNYTYIPNEELLKRWHSVDLSNTRYYFGAVIIDHENLSNIYKLLELKHQG